jgi:hypothetical protein
MRDTPPAAECYICLTGEETYDSRGDWNEWRDAHVSCERELAELLNPGESITYNGHIFSKEEA